MNALKPRPPFQVLIMSEESRLGREAIETAYALKQLVTAGVRGEVRYFRDLVDNQSRNTTNIDFGYFHFWRASLGAVLAF